MNINKKAPVQVSSEIEITASPDVVWDVLTDIEHWPRWNPDVKWATLDGPLASGTEFRWKAGPSTIKSVLQTVEPIHLVGWTGKTMGIEAVDIYKIEPHNGHTLVRNEESWDGWIVHIFRNALQKSLEKSATDGLETLKAGAERRASN